MKLSDQNIRALPLQASGQAYYPDDLVPGLSVCVGKRGKTFTVVVRENTRRRRITLGPYAPPHFTLAMARDRARDAIAQARLAKTETPRITFHEAYRTYDHVHISQLRRTTQKQIRGRIERHFMPALGKKALLDIKPTDIAPLLDPMLKTPTELHNSFVYLGMFLTWCMKRGYIETVPTSRMQTPKKPPSRERVLAADELVKIWHAADPATDYGRILRLSILSGQRVGQWSTLKREHISQDAITWPGDAMKAGRSHTLPLTETMRSLLPDRIGFIFPTDNIRGFSNWSRNKARLDKAVAIPDFRQHDLRRTWATISAEELNTEWHIIEAVLAHAIGTRIARTYNRARYVKPMREALEAFEKWFVSHLKPSTSNQTAL